MGIFGRVTKRRPVGLCWCSCSFDGRAIVKAEAIGRIATAAQQLGITVMMRSDHARQVGMISGLIVAGGISIESLPCMTPEPSRRSSLGLAIRPWLTESSLGPIAGAMTKRKTTLNGCQGYLNRLLQRKREYCGVDPQ